MTTKEVMYNPTYDQLFAPEVHLPFNCKLFNFHIITCRWGLKIQTKLNNNVLTRICYLVLWNLLILTCFNLRTNEEHTILMVSTNNLISLICTYIYGNYGNVNIKSRSSIIFSYYKWYFLWLSTCTMLYIIKSYWVSTLKYSISDIIS